MLGQRFLTARKLRGLSSEQTAEQLGVSRSYISAIENGRRSNVGSLFLSRAAALLNVPPGYLLGQNIPPIFHVLIHLHLIGNLPDDVYGSMAKMAEDVLKEAGVDFSGAAKNLGLDIGQK